MSRAGVERPLEESALREIERSLHGKLKAHRLPETFIARYSEDAVQKGFLAYLRAKERGVEVDNRDAFIVQAAFRRALDELRHETREADGAALEAVLERGDLASPPTEELAVEHLAARELHEAIGTLPPEARQVLALHYFEELSDRRGAEALYCSERTFRRRLAKALDALSRKLGASVPEPGSELALEVGLAAFVSLRGADVLLRRGRLAPIADAFDW
ncbi:MAG TPA: RNA polymerase sigma factor, partial [Solirubrobacterales bacterium]|nr:RNA polymerase sigma factor [Solirubrobacterales bacterium]